MLRTVSQIAFLVALTGLATGLPFEAMQACPKIHPQTFDIEKAIEEMAGASFSIERMPNGPDSDKICGRARNEIISVSPDSKQKKIVGKFLSKSRTTGEVVPLDYMTIQEDPIGNPLLFREEIVGFPAPLYYTAVARGVNAEGLRWSAAYNCTMGPDGKPMIVVLVTASEPHVSAVVLQEVNVQLNQIGINSDILEKVPQPDDTCPPPPGPF